MKNRQTNLNKIFSTLKAILILTVNQSLLSLKALKFKEPTCAKFLAITKILLFVIGIVFTAFPLSAFVRDPEVPEDPNGLPKATQEETLQQAWEPGILIVQLKKNVSKDSAELLSGLGQIAEIERIHPVFHWTDSSSYYQDLEEAKQKYAQRQKRAPSTESAKELPDLTRYYVVEYRNKDLDMKQAAESLENSLREYIDSVHPNYEMKVNFTPNDPFFNSSNSWGHQYEDMWPLKPERMNLERAWDLSQGEGVVVAVVDTGLDYNHQDIDQNVWTNPGEIPNNGIDDDRNGFIDDVRGWDFGNSDNDPIDGHGHGTHISGLIAAEGNNAYGIIGVAWRSRIMPVKGFTDGGGGFLDRLAAAIIYAARNGADIINNSWSCGPSCSSVPVLEDAVRTAYGLGAMCIFSAGDRSSDLTNFSPQNMTNPKPLVVGASDPIDQDSYETNFGWSLDFVAPGRGSGLSPWPRYILPIRNILSLKSNICSSSFCQDVIVANNYVRSSGSSIAAAYASGVSALVMAYRPQFTLTDISNALRISADNAGYRGRDRFSGYGRLNAFRALQQNRQVFFSVTVDSVREIQGNMDGRLNPGERGRASVRLHNMWLGASNIRGKVSSLLPTVQIVNGGFSIPTMAPDERRTLEIDFNIAANAITPTPFQFSFFIRSSRVKQIIKPVPVSWIEPLAIRDLPYLRAHRGYQATDGFGGGSGWGKGVAALPDLNGDGITDYIVGAPYAKPQNPDELIGAAYVFSGADGTRIHAVYGECRRYVPGGRCAPPHFGSSVASAGDFNGDGGNDFMVAASQDNGTAIGGGKVQVFSGSDGSLLHTFLGNVDVGWLGWQVIGLGDTNSDGFGDVAVSEPAPAEDPRLKAPRKLYLFSGRDGSILHEWESPVLYRNIFVWKDLVNAGDINGDRINDIAFDLVCADPLCFTPSYQVYSGASPYELLVEKTGSSFNKDGISSLTRLGDVNDDGIPDLVAGYPDDYEFYTESPRPGGPSSLFVDQGGKVSVFSGRDGEELFSIFGKSSERLGKSVGLVGDIDCDSYPDFVASSEERTPICRTQANRCPIYVYSGKTGQLLYRIVASGEYANVLIFWHPAISPLGDINGDGSNEFALGFGNVNGRNNPEPGLLLIYSGDICS